MPSIIAKDSALQITLKFEAILLAIFSLGCILTGCGAQMRNIPVGEQKIQLCASMGGPIVDAFDTTIPLPYGLLGATYGISERTEAYVDLHITAAAYKLVGLTTGVIYFPLLGLERVVPAIGFDVLIFSDFNESRIYPELVTSAAYQLSNCWTPYVALRHTFQTTKPPFYIPSAMTGTSYRTGKMQYFVELQWLDFNSDNRWNPVSYHGVSNHGALSFQIGATLDLPKWKRVGK